MLSSSLPALYGVGLAGTSLGLVTNGFIAVTVLSDWAAGRKLKPFDKIFLSLGLSRLVHMLLFIFNIMNRLFRLNVYHDHVLNAILNMTYLFLDFSSLWFSMWLCVLYFVKVTIFTNSLLIRIKLRIPQLVVYMILSSVLMASLSGFMLIYNYNQCLDLMIPEINPPSNSSFKNELVFLVPSYFLGHFLPFAMVSVSTTFLIRTIAGHVRRIRGSASSFTFPKMDAHLSAIRSVCLLELMTVCYFIATLLLRFNFYRVINNAVIFTLVIAYPTFHSMLLIAGNAKLKKRLLDIFHCEKNM